MFSNATYPGVDALLEDNKNFKNIDNILYFSSAQRFIQVPWSILEAEIYMFDQEKPIDLKSSFKTRVILASYDPEILFNSVVKFYDLEFRYPDMNPIYQLNTGKIISCNRLNLNSFTINSMKLLANSTLLSLGV